MEAQVHILCSHCEKVLVEVPKEKVQTQKGNVSNVPENPASVEKVLIRSNPPSISNRNRRKRKNLLIVK